MGALVNVPRFCMELIESGTIEGIIACVHSRDDELEANALSILGYLLELDETRKFIRKSAQATTAVVLRLLNRFQPSPSQSTQQQQIQPQLVVSCVKVLDALAIYEDCIAEITDDEHNAVSLLLAFTSFADNLSVGILSLLTRFSQLERCRSLFTDKFMGWACETLQQGEGAVVRGVVAVLSNLVASAAHKNMLRANSGIAALVAVLRDPALSSIRPAVLTIISALSADGRISIFFRNIF